MLVSNLLPNSMSTWRYLPPQAPLLKKQSKSISLRADSLRTTSLLTRRPPDSRMLTWTPWRKNLITLVNKTIISKDHLSTKKIKQLIVMVLPPSKRIQWPPHRQSSMSTATNQTETCKSKTRLGIINKDVANLCSITTPQLLSKIKTVIRQANTLMQQT